MNFFHKFFSRKKEKTVNEILEEIKIGDLVSVEYKHPKELGIVTSNSLTHTRLNKEELEKRNIKGTVSLVRKVNPHNIILIEVVSYESPSMMGMPRKFLFLGEEIAKIKVMT